LTLALAAGFLRLSLALPLAGARLGASPNPQNEALCAKFLGGLGLRLDGRRPKPPRNFAHRASFWKVPTEKRWAHFRWNCRGRGVLTANFTAPSGSTISAATKSGEARRWAFSLPPSSSRLFVRGLVVLRQQVKPEVAVEVAPDAVDVVAVVLRLVELDQEYRRLHAVVVQVVAIDAARPREVQVRL